MFKNYIRHDSIIVRYFGNAKTHFLLWHLILTKITCTIEITPDVVYYFHIFPCKQHLLKIFCHSLLTKTAPLFQTHRMPTQEMSDLYDLKEFLSIQWVYTQHGNIVKMLLSGNGLIFRFKFVSRKWEQDWLTDYFYFDRLRP